MSLRIFRGDARVDVVAADDRGIAYGDGLFETMRVHAGGIPWLDRHWARLQAGAARLAIALPARARVEAGLRELLAEDPQAGIARLVLTRGSGARGYAPPPAAHATWIGSTHPAPRAVAGLDAIRCRLRLGIQPALAGIKHCNRLEQVLARAEVEAAGAADGLVFDADGALACATAGNLLLHGDGAWWTPPVDRCGVAGVMRGWLLESGLVRERRLGDADVAGARGIAVCNAVQGILPVLRLDGEALPPADLDGMRAALARAHPAFR